MTAEDEARIIKKYLGIEYRHMGRDPATGLDCWGFIKCVFRDEGHALIDLEDYAQHWSRDGHNYFLDNYYDQFREVEAPKPLDIVLFKTKQGIPNHAGIVLRNGRFIHCCKAGVVKNSLTESSWKPRVFGYYRIKANDIN